VAKLRPRKGRPLVWLLGVPTALVAVIFAAVADNQLAAGITGALVGFFIGLALLAFPDLDRGGPADRDDMLQ